MVLYVGIADAIGIDAFVKEGEAPIGMLQLRAMQNRHRFAMVFRAGLSKEEGQKIEKMFKENSKKALLYLKKLGEEGKADIAVEAGAATRHWDKIPNEDLMW